MNWLLVIIQMIITVWLSRTRSNKENIPIPASQVRPDPWVRVVLNTEVNMMSSRVGNHNCSSRFCLLCQPVFLQWELQEWCSLIAILEVQPGRGALTKALQTGSGACLVSPCGRGRWKCGMVPETLYFLCSLFTRERQRTPWSWTCRLCAEGTCRGQLAASQVL